jgi:hypothetical protein
MAPSQYADQNRILGPQPIEHETRQHRSTDDIERIQACGEKHECISRNARDVQALWTAHDTVMSSLNGLTKAFNDAIRETNAAFNEKFDKLQWSVISAMAAIILTCMTLISNTIFHFWK